MDHTIEGREVLLARASALESRAGKAGTPEEGVAALIELATLRKDRLEDLEGAIAALRRAVQLMPGHRAALNRYAQACALAERWAELVDVLELSARAARSDEERARVLAHRGDVLGKKLGRIAEARSMYRDVARLAEDASLVAAANAAVERIDGLLAPGGAPPRERTFVGRRSSVGARPGSVVADRPSITEERVEHHNRAARLALEEGRRADARAWVDQALALRPWSPTALSIRHDILRSEGRWADLVKLLKIEATDAPEPAIAAGALREAAEATADALGDFEGAVGLLRRSIEYAGQEDLGTATLMRLALRHRRFDSAQRLWPELSADDRAQRIEHRAAAASAAGDAESALLLRAMGFEDRPSDVGFFQARLQVLERLGDGAAIEAALVSRLELVSEPDERRALTWELVSILEQQQRWREAIERLIAIVVHVERDDEVDAILDAIERMAARIADRAPWVRALELASTRPRSPRVDAWLVRLGRARRDELMDVEGAESALARAVALGAPVASELAELRAKLRASGVDLVPRTVELLDNDTVEMDGAELIGALRRPRAPERVPSSQRLTLPPDGAPPRPRPVDREVTPVDPPTVRGMRWGDEVTEEPFDRPSDPADRTQQVLLPAASEAEVAAGAPDPALDALAVALLGGEAPTAAAWLSAGWRQARARERELARSCFERGLDAAQRDGAERAAAAIVDAAWARAGEPLDPELLTALRVLELGGQQGRALAVRCAAIAELWGEHPTAERWLEATLDADAGVADAAARLSARALARGDLTAARAWLLRSLPDPRPSLGWCLAAAELDLAEDKRPEAARALALALEVGPLDLEAAHRLAALGVSAEQPEWLARGTAELRDRLLWGRELGRAVRASGLRRAAKLDDALDRLLLALELEGEDLGPAPEALDPATPEGRDRLLGTLSGLR